MDIRAQLNQAPDCVRYHLPTLGGIIKKELAQFKKKSRETLELSVGRLLALKDELGLVESAAEEEKINKIIEELKSIIEIPASDENLFESSLNSWLNKNAKTNPPNSRLEEALKTLILAQLISHQNQVAIYKLIFSDTLLTRNILKQLLSNQSRVELLGLIRVSSRYKVKHLSDLLDISLENYISTKSKNPFDEHSIRNFFEDIDLRELITSFKVIEERFKIEFVTKVIDKTTELKTELDDLFNSYFAKPYMPTQDETERDIDIIKKIADSLRYYQVVIINLISQDFPNKSLLLDTLINSFKVTDRFESESESHLLENRVKFYHFSILEKLANIVNLSGILDQESSNNFKEKIEECMISITNSSVRQNIEAFKEAFCHYANIYQRLDSHQYNQFLLNILNSELNDEESPLINQDLRIFILENLDTDFVETLIARYGPVQSGNRFEQISYLSLLALFNISSSNLKNIIESDTETSRSSKKQLEEIVESSPTETNNPYEDFLKSLINESKEKLELNAIKLKGIFQRFGFQKGIYNLIKTYEDSPVNGFMILSDCLDDNIKQRLLEYYSSNPADCPYPNQLPDGALKDWLTSLKPQK